MYSPSSIAGGSPSSIAISGKYAAPCISKLFPFSLPLSSVSAVSWEMVGTDTRELVMVWKYLV